MNVADLKLPELMAVACNAGGMEAVRKLSEAFGGRLVYIPQRDNCPENHLLVQAGGRAVADALCLRFGGDTVEFPRGVKTLQLYLSAGLIADGKSNNQIADALGISWRQARRLRKKLKGKGGVALALAERRSPPRKESAQIDIEDYLLSSASKHKA